MKKNSRPVRRAAVAKEEIQSPVVRVGIVFLIIMAVAVVAYVVKVYLP